MIKTTRQILQSDAVWQKIYKTANQFPHLYATLVAALAFCGFAYLLLFPLLLVSGLWVLATQTFSEQFPGNIMYLVFWLGITVLAGAVTVYLVQLRFNKTDGVQLTGPMADKIFRVLGKINVQVPIPHIDRIVVTEQLSLDVVKTPVAALPVWSNNTLVIGLPLMQCLSPDYFECALTRKLLQYSKHRHWFMKWLHQLRNTWMLYLRVLSSNVTFSNFLLLMFFQLYAPLYRNLSTPVAHRCELEADKDSLEIVNDEDLLQTIETVIVSKIYLDQQYWPKIGKMLRDGSRQSVQPYTKLEDILKVGLTSKNTRRWLDTLYTHEPNRINAIPGLRARMNNIGRSRIRIPEKINQTAANYFLDKNYPAIVAQINRLWHQRHNQAGAATAANDAALAAQNSASAATTLSGNLFH